MATRETKWTEAMDGSPASVDLHEAVTSNPRIDGHDYEWTAVPPHGPNGWGNIVWQHGPILEVGRNGVLLEELLEFVVIPRLKGLNRERIPAPQGQISDGLDGQIANPFRCEESTHAIARFEEGLNWLKRRTELRRRQGVEGTFWAHASS
jgi:hypothetical protein